MGVLSAERWVGCRTEPRLNIRLPALTPKGSFLATIAGVTAGTIVTFVITSLILKMEKNVETESEDGFAESARTVKAMKQEGKFSYKILNASLLFVMREWVLVPWGNHVS